MKYLAMIQARCGSTRLPNKVMKDLCGKPVLQRMIERVQKSRMIDEVMVVTSIEKENLPIVKLCAELNIRVGIGSE
ncbi:MAG: spore coat protein, partial [Clostridia bacterium]|nr:spore coat protein [Clostridia bacterium]